MSFASILAKLVTKDSQARDAADSVYRELVADAAADRTVPETKITAILASCGKTLNDLQRDVAAEQERLANLSTVARRSEIMAALSANNAARMAEDKRYSDAVNEAFESHGNAVAAIQARDAELSRELSKIDAAERRLIATGSPDRLQGITDELQELARKEQLLASIGRRSDGNIERQRKAITSKRRDLFDERDKIRGELLTSN